MYANFRRVIVPDASRPTTPTRDPTPAQDPDPTPTQDPDPTPTWLRCNYCSRLFCSIHNVRGVVAQAREPNTSYYVTNYLANTYRPGDGLIISERITAENEETNLTVTRIYCDTCRQPAGWKVLQLNRTHPIVDIGHFLLPVTPFPPPPPPPPQL